MAIEMSLIDLSRRFSQESDTMNRSWLFLAILALPLWAYAQSSNSGPSRPSTPQVPYQPVVPAPSNVTAYGGWPGGYSGGTTAAGSAMNGMASVISAQGERNLSNSAAAVNMTQAQKNEIENRQQWTNTYFDMRSTNKAARDKERGPNPTMEQLARLAREGVPKPLAPTQVNPVSGQIAWPDALQEQGFESQRRQVEELFAARARYGGLSFADQMQVRNTLDDMAAALKKQIRDIPPADYIASKNFLASLNYTATQTSLN
jgi:hypothetical protein